jgi:hypothetical protein
MLRGMFDRKPWEIEPDLAAKRLVWVARTFAEIHQETVRTHEPSRGDGPWSLGCRLYDRKRNRLIQAARSGDVPWLRILDSSLAFQFAIGRVRLRFYGGPPEEPAQNMRDSFPELRQRSLPLGRIDDPATFAWCIAVETDATRLVSAVTLAAFSLGDELLYSFVIPFDAAGREDPSPVIPLAPPPVDIPPPNVSGPATKKKASEDEED